MNYIQKRQMRVLKMVYTALCIALCVVIPQAFHMIPEFGKIYSPLHIPVLICGVLCGWQYGLICGVCGPLLATFCTGLPTFASLWPMMVECAVYGLVSGLLMKLIRTKITYINILSSVIVAMIAGRIVSGAARALIFSPGTYAMDTWITAYFITSLPGIVVHIILVPLIALTLMKLSMFPDGKSYGKRK